MQQEMQKFYWSRPKELRTKTEPDGSIWFVAKDVCDMLDLEQVTNALKGLDEDEKGVTKINTLGGPQEVNIINEPGLYRLAFRSNKAEAKAFTRWVTHEVLPSIRKTGGYGQKYRVIGRKGRKLIDVAPLHLDLIEKIKSGMLYGDLSLMARETGIKRDRIKNYLAGMIQKPNLQLLQQMLQWVESRRMTPEKNTFLTN